MWNETVLNQLEVNWLSPDYDPDDYEDPDEDEEYQRWEDER